MEGKTYLAMDLPVYGEADGANFISLEDCMVVYLSTCTI